MDEITIVRRRLNREKWFQIINECRSSEMPVNKWCKANGLCEQTYYKWLKKFREETLENQKLPAVIETRSSEVIVPQEFAPLPVIPAPSKSSGITISIGQIKIDISDGTSPDTIKTTLQAVKKLC